MRVFVKYAPDATAWAGEAARIAAALLLSPLLLVILAFSANRRAGALRRILRQQQRDGQKRHRTKNGREHDGGGFFTSLGHGLHSLFPTPYSLLLKHQDLLDHAHQRVLAIG